MYAHDPDRSLWPSVHKHTDTHNTSDVQSRLKVAVLIKHIKLTTDVIDQKANSSSIIVSEERKIVKWLCDVFPLGKHT